MIHLFASFMGVEQWLVILVVVLLLFGGAKIPELLRGVGRGVGELQKGLEDGKRALQTSIQDEQRKAEAASVTPEATSTTSTTVPK